MFATIRVLYVRWYSISKVYLFISSRFKVCFKKLYRRLKFLKVKENTRLLYMVDVGNDLLKKCIHFVLRVF